MHIPHLSRFGKKITIIQPGEYHVSADDEMIGTLLGSCVSVCLHDPVCQISGMNHFMLPGKMTASDILQDRSARYGITAINELLEQMELAGAFRDNLIAKVFGGGHVLLTLFDSSTLPYENIRLARVMLEIEDIPIEEIDVGGAYARKIIMEVKTGKVFLKNIMRNKIIEELNEEEISFLEENAVNAL